MNIFIDTSVKGCNVALFDDKKILKIIQEPIERGHAETLVPLIEQAMSDTGKTPQDIKDIYVTIGPGSFTGLRVGLTVAQFIGFSLNKPVHGITTFQVFSCGVIGDCNRAILINTKRSDYYYQILDGHHKPINEPQSVSADKITIDDEIVTGDAANQFRDETNFTDDIQSQEMIDLKAVVKAIQSNELDYHKPEAFYIRDVDVSQPKKAKTQ